MLSLLTGALDASQSPKGKQMASPSLPQFKIRSLLLFLLAGIIFTALILSTEISHSLGGVIKGRAPAPPLPFDDSFSELDFIATTRAAGNLTEQEWLKEYRHYYGTNVWKIRAKLLTERIRKLGVPTVKFASNERRDEEPAPPYCQQQDIDNPPSTSFSLPSGAFKRKVWDAVLFLNELDMLEMRLMELENVVDKFILVQCPLTFMNHTANMVDVTKMERFRKWWPQIENAYCDLAEFPMEAPSPWVRENHMRNVLWDSVRARAGSEDLIMTGDLDELPKAHLIHELRQEKEASKFPVVLEMPLWRFTFACIDRDWMNADHQWSATVITMGKFANGNHWDDEIKEYHKDGHTVRMKLRNDSQWHKKLRGIKCAGWHCSSCLPVDDYVTKISEYSHAKEMPNEYRDKDVVRETQETCMFGVLYRLRSRKGLPQGIVNQPERFNYMLPQ